MTEPVNLPIEMTRPDEIRYAEESNGAEKEIPVGNLWKDFWDQKAAFFESLETGNIPNVSNGLTVFYPKDVVVLHRRRDFYGVEYELKNGVPWIKVNTHKAKDPEIKHDTKLVWTPNTLMVTFNRVFNGESLVGDISSDELRKRRFTEYAIKQSLINVVRKKSNKHVYMNGNDVLIEKKKILGAETFSYDYQYHEHAVIIFKYEPELFEKYLKDDKNHLNSIKKRGLELKDETDGSTGSFIGMTGVGNEIPGYTKQEFAEDMLKEMNYFLMMIQ